MNNPPLPAHFRAARRWFLTGTLALALAGLFAFLMLSDKAFFHKGLVIHVDLSVLVWFMAVAGMLWSLHGKPSLLGAASLGCFFAGMLLLPISSFSDSGEGLMNNYIPIITHHLFYMGLSLLLLGVVFAALRFLFCVVRHPATSETGDLHPCFTSPLFFFALSTAAVIVLVSVAALFLTYPRIPAEISGVQFYDLLFWAGGHILQFAHTQLVMLVWLCLAAVSGIGLRLSRRALYVLFSVNLLVALAGLAGTLPDPSSSRYYDFYIRLMRDGNGIAPALLMLALIHGLLTQKRPSDPQARAPYIALIASLVLFGVGGLIGFAIRGSNTMIPAHYHGSIVGITLAYMGLCYYLMPRLGFARVGHWKLAAAQPVIYCIGQIIWIAGMFIRGGYGMARKQAGTPEAEGAYAKLGDFLKHGGDGLALIGGLLFVVIVIRALRPRARLETHS